ncbi:MAG: insulinase family protein [Deltaproteobacteria bacterium]|nr:insulinase family protein [Deltaproteobacteria bacterium]
MKVFKMYQKTVLSNGIRIITEKIEHYKSVSLGIWVGTGSRDENNINNGVSHFIEHMLFKGTPSRDTLKIARELDAIGGLSNAFTGKEYTCFHSKVLDKDFLLLAEILSDIFLHSTFNPEDIEREKQVVLQEIGMVEDSPEEQVHELFNTQFFNNHPLGLPVLGSSETVTAMTRDEILEHMKMYYSPDRIIIAAAGNVEHDCVVNAFERQFEKMEPVSKENRNFSHELTSSIICSYKELEQINICMGGKAHALTSDMRFAGAVLNTILGGNMSSRLFQEIREKRGLAYSIYSFLSAYMDTGLLGICVGTDPNEVNNVLDVINAEIIKIQEGDLSETDLDEARDHLIGGILLGSENTDSRMMRLAKNEFVFGRCIEYEELVEKLKKVTLDDIMTCIRYAFAPGGVAITTLGSVNREDLKLENNLFFP